MSVAKTLSRVRVVGIFLCSLVLGPLTGCTTFQTVCSSKWLEGAFPVEEIEVDHIAVRWDNRLRTAPDPTNYTATTPGLLGRVYLFSEENKKTCEANGAIVVAMLDMTPTVSGRAPVPV